MLADLPDINVLVLGHTQEIVQQNEDKILQIWPEANVGIFCSGLKRKEIKQITSASRDSIIKEIGESPNWDLVIIDEAHLISSVLLRHLFVCFLAKYLVMIKPIYLKN